MNEEYLWDKSGEPEPEVQELEQVLGTLRYQPKPLQRPERLVRAQTNYRPLAAIAATVVLTLLAALLWSRLGVEKRTPPQRVESAQNVEVKSPNPPQLARSQSNSEDAHQVVSPPQRSTPATPRANRVAGKRNRTSSTLNAGELAEAVKAKQQLLIALRLASEKLNLAQKKVQNPTAPNQIRNQHKIG
jgi:cytoskeletal protein RodZ